VVDFRHFPASHLMLWVEMPNVRGGGACGWSGYRCSTRRRDGKEKDECVG
jgi:hypothetical protein